jgi:hypothetical protein
MENCYLCPQPRKGTRNGLNCCGAHDQMMSRYEMKADEWGNSEMCEIIEDIGLTKILNDPETMKQTIRVLHMAYGKKKLDLSQKIFLEEREVIVPFMSKAREEQFKSEIEELMIGDTGDIIRYLGSACFSTITFPKWALFKK